MLRKFGALVLALLMVVSVSTSAFAAEFTNGIAGEWSEKDTVVLKNERTIVVKKDLKTYNATSTSVFAPAFSYQYTVTPANVSSLQVTDDANDHVSGTSVNAPVNAGKTAGLKVNNGAAGDASSAFGYLDISNTTSVTASSSGAVTSFDISLDFTGVTFDQPGVYRYQIDETIIGSDHSTAVTYDNIAIKDNTAANANTRWLDVYVDGEGKIYGYVCMAANDSVTTQTAKTNGFVVGSKGEDEYYTYDLTLSKDVKNDAYAEANVAFPFTVIFNNSENYTTTFTITESVGTGSKGINPAAASAPTWNGVAEVKDGGAITYTGIPAGVDVDVYETNIVTGVTYIVETSINGGEAIKDNNVSWGSKPETAVAQTTQAAYESKKATVNTPKIAAVSAEQTLAITNTLLLISPTGVVLRIAPYVMILAAGIALLLISRRRKAGAEE